MHRHVMRHVMHRYGVPNRGVHAHVVYRHAIHIGMSCTAMSCTAALYMDVLCIGVYA